MAHTIETDTHPLVPEHDQLLEHGQFEPWFTPTETWSTFRARREIEPEIRAARDSVQQDGATEEGYRRLVAGLQEKVELAPNGTVLAVMDGEDPDKYSSKRSFVLFNPFGSTERDLQLIRAETLRRVFQNADLRDEDGLLIPIIMVANPGAGGSQFALNPKELASTTRGDLSPIARRATEAVAGLGFRQVDLMGFSNGAALALAAAQEENRSGLQIGSVTVGDPSTVEDRAIPTLMRDFGRAGTSEFTRALINSNQSPLLKAGTSREERVGFMLSVLNAHNIAQALGLGAPTFESQVDALLSTGHRVTVGYGANSAITRKSAMEANLMRLYYRYGDEELTSIEVTGPDADHTWGDQIQLIAKLYLRGARGSFLPSN